jgi:hypothetical protein
MDSDPELKQKILEDQRRRGKIYRELLKAKKWLDNWNKSLKIKS